ncbi:MAG: hypothetical protein J7K87_00935 [Candidatus Aenigmarchaeota archaeon]|nr:hypothetical protein [Candidatus Aenigmarchaeota archaeon]
MSREVDAVLGSSSLGPDEKVVILERITYGSGLDKLYKGLDGTPFELTDEEKMDIYKQNA